MKIFYFIPFIVITFILMSCNEDTISDNNKGTIAHKVTITLNGGDFSNETHTIETPLFISSGATLDTASISTYCKVYGSPEDIPYSVDIVFPNQEIGSYSWEGLLQYSFINIQLTSSSSGFNQLISTTDGKTTITSYGKVGELIIGNFNGDFIQRSTYDTVNINGNFSIQRIK